MNGINRYADSWRRHQSLWKTDKGSVLDKFKAREPSNMAFEEKLSKYSKVMHTERQGGVWTGFQGHGGPSFYAGQITDFDYRCALCPKPDTMLAQHLYLRVLKICLPSPPPKTPDGPGAITSGQRL